MSPPLDAQLAALLSRRRSRSLLRSLTTVPPNTVDFSSNAYLSLSSHPVIQSTYLSLLQSALEPTPTASPSPLPPSPDPPSPLGLGSGGSRLLDGNSPFAEGLERSISVFHGAAAGLLFNSGLDANTGLFASVPQPGDTVVYDALVHASVHDGMRLSRAVRRLPFAHNDAADLRAVLLAEAARHAAMALTPTPNVFVAVEAVYSMDGDVAPLREIVDAVEHALPRGNGYVVVDEAHSTGLFGERGRGLVCALGLEDRVFARVCTFGKALSCAGAVVLSSAVTREYLINYARSLIYTTAMPFPSLASIKVMYDFISSGQAEPLLSNLHALCRLLHTRLVDLCAQYPSGLLRTNNDRPRSPIVPLFTSQPRSLAQHCQRNGFMVRAIVAPTVPEGSERVRICLHAGNTAEEIEGLVRVIGIWAEQNSSEGISTWAESPKEKARL